MTNKEAINLLDNLIGMVDDNQHSDYDQALHMGIDALKAEPQWIPCSERLPEYDGEPYLVTDYCEQINCKRMHISYCYMNREGFWSDVPIRYKVIAWMPLPEPFNPDDFSQYMNPPED